MVTAAPRLDPEYPAPEARAAKLEAVTAALEALRDSTPGVAGMIGTGPPDVEIDYRTDALGDPAIFVSVFVPDEVDPLKVPPSVVGVASDAAFEAAFDGPGGLFPYVGFRKRSDFGQAY